MTKRLYHEDPYQREFTANVAELRPEGVILDQTCFYAESGGQPGDVGNLNGVPVTDTKFIGEEKDSNILHYCDSSKFSFGQQVSGQIDWQRRHKLMRVHSSMHLALAVAQELLGSSVHIAGSGMDPDKGRLDLACEGKLDAAAKDKIHARFKELVSKCIEMKTWNDAEKGGYRISQISGFPEMPCGGTHIKNTSEIGEVTMKRESKGKGIVRLTVSLV